MKKIIEFKNICKSYGNNKIIENFNLQIKEGEFITVVGTSGSGKTTLLKMINGLITPDSGEIEVEGVEILKQDIYALRKRIGYVIQNVGLMPHMNVEKNINYVPNLESKDKVKDRERAKRLLEYVGLEEKLLTSNPLELSGGQQQRLGIARALANDPKILLMDEPFGALDEITRLKLQEEIIKLHKKINTTVFFITHDIKEALALGTKILLISKGKNMYFGTKEDLLTKEQDEFVKNFFKNYTL
jgi:osmoprotectant transport system ATP-binding protein